MQLEIFAYICIVNMTTQNDLKKSPTIQVEISLIFGTQQA